MRHKGRGTRGGEVTLGFPSREFDEAVAAVCHGLQSSEQALALNDLLRRNTAARDEYILRVEIHTNLASEKNLFQADSDLVVDGKVIPSEFPSSNRANLVTWGMALAACVALAAIMFWSRSRSPQKARLVTSRAVAMLNTTVDAHWGGSVEPSRIGVPLEPGWLRLESGLAQIVFYSGTRVVIEGPAEIELISPNEFSCKEGHVLADVPAQAHGFIIQTPQLTLTNSGTSLGLSVKERSVGIQVFQGAVDLRGEHVREGTGVSLNDAGMSKRPVTDRAAFAALFGLRQKSVAAEALRFEQWQVASEEINRDPALLVHFGFDELKPADWHIENQARSAAADTDAIMVGCQLGEGRWREKRSLEFQSVNDRVRLNVPGEYESLTLSAWTLVKGLDRKINSIFMSDGFRAGTVHWLLRNDGSPGITVIGASPGDYQIVMGPPVITLDKFGMWIHLAAVVDGPARQVTHYLNGVPVSRTTLKIEGPFQIGAAELGNWNAKGFPNDDPFMIRNFSGAIDEFCAFSRALDANEIRGLYAEGKPQGDAVSLH